MGSSRELRAYIYGRYPLISQAKINHNITFYEGQKMETIIRQLDKSTVVYLRKRVSDALEPLEKELGVTFDMSNCTFNVNNCRFQLKVAVLDPNGEPITEEIESFKHNAKIFGFEPDDLGREFVYRGQSYTVCGLNPKSRKYPVVARSGNGKDYRFPCSIVLKALGKEVPAWLGDK
jgi:hypothetical protein